MGIAAIPRARSLRRAVAALLVAHVSPHPLVVLLERSAATAPVKPVFAQHSHRAVRVCGMRVVRRWPMNPAALSAAASNGEGQSTPSHFTSTSASPKVHFQIAFLPLGCLHTDDHIRSSGERTPGFAMGFLFRMFHRDRILASRPMPGSTKVASTQLKSRRASRDSHSKRRLEVNI